MKLQADGSDCLCVLRVFGRGRCVIFLNNWLGNRIDFDAVFLSLRAKSGQGRTRRKAGMSWHQADEPGKGHEGGGIR